MRKRRGDGMRAEEQEAKAEKLFNVIEGELEMVERSDYIEILRDLHSHIATAIEAAEEDAKDDEEER
jgi:hypothetical protein